MRQKYTHTMICTKWDGRWLYGGEYMDGYMVWWWVYKENKEKESFLLLFIIIIIHEEPRKVPLLIILSDSCYAQFPVRNLPPISCMLAGVRLAVISSDLHRGDEIILNFATVCWYGWNNTRRGKYIIISWARSFQLFPGSDQPDHAIIVWSICGFNTFCRFLVENFCVDLRSKSLPLEAIGIWKNI